MRFPPALGVAVLAAAVAATALSSGQTSSGWEIVVLGIAQDAGIPQLGCDQELCRSIREGKRRPERVSSLGLVNRSLGLSYLFDATPDVVSQLGSLNGGKAPTAVFLTHGHIGHYTGLMYFGRESLDAKGVPVYGSERMAAFLKGNGPWSLLVSRGNIETRVLTPDKPNLLEDGMRVTAFTVPHRDEFTDTVGYVIERGSRRALFIPDIDQWSKWSRSIRDLVDTVSLAFLDGTFASADELPGRSIADIPHPLISNTRELLRGSKAAVWFIHLEPYQQGTWRARRRHRRPAFSVLGPAQSRGLRAICSPPGLEVVMRSRVLRTWCLAIAAATLALAPWGLLAQAPTPSKVKFAAINEADMREYLGYLASDALQGRQIYTEGYGLAASYIAEHLRQWGLKPMGDDGTYFQSVKNRGYRITRNSSVTVEVNGQSRTFKHGEHVTFQANSGGKQTLTFDGMEFVGYGIVSLPNATSNINYNDFAGRDVKSKAIFWMNGTPTVLTQGAAGGRGRAGGNRANYALQTLGAAAVFGYASAPPPPAPADAALQQAQDALVQAQTAVANAQAASRGGAGRGGRAGGGGGRAGAPAQVPADITTVQRVDMVIPPVITGDDEFYDFLLGASGMKFADIKARSEKGDTLAPGPIRGVKVTVNVDNTYEVLSTQLSKNVVGMIEGTDPKLKDTYVLFGAHLDHVGYRPAVTAGGRGGGRGAAAGGPPDLIFNGADDDGSGSTALLGIAKAFATGPKPKRSVIIVWHTGEEAGLLGSRYMADFPVVPLEKVQAQFNIDMIGRNRDDDAGQANTVFVIGADRISTDLHNLVVDSNNTLAKPLTLDYEYNDPSDPNSFYTRSDHYSYAAKGIPIAFFFTGTHPDYHGAGDSPDKILYPKLTAIAQMVYQSGFNAANSDRTLTRDNKGPRAGRGFSGRIDK